MGSGQFVTGGVCQAEQVLCSYLHFKMRKNVEKIISSLILSSVCIYRCHILEVLFSVWWRGGD